MNRIKDTTIRKCKARVRSKLHVSLSYAKYYDPSKLKKLIDLNIEPLAKAKWSCTLRTPVFNFILKALIKSLINHDALQRQLRKRQVIASLAYLVRAVYSLSLKVLINYKTILLTNLWTVPFQMLSCGTICVCLKFESFHQ